MRLTSGTSDRKLREREEFLNRLNGDRLRRDESASAQNDEEETDSLVGVVEEIVHSKNESSRQRERSSQFRQSRDEQSFDSMQRYTDEQHVPERVESTSSSSSRTLSEVERGEEDRISSEDAGLGRSVDSDRERSGGDDDSKNTSSVEILDQSSVSLKFRISECGLQEKQNVPYSYQRDALRFHVAER